MATPPQKTEPDVTHGFRIVNGGAKHLQWLWLHLLIAACFVTVRIPEDTYRNSARCTRCVERDEHLCIVLKTKDRVTACISCAKARRKCVFASNAAEDNKAIVQLYSAIERSIVSSEEKNVQSTVCNIDTQIEILETLNKVAKNVAQCKVYVKDIVDMTPAIGEELLCITTLLSRMGTSE